MLANHTQEQTDRENRETCIRIAKELEAIADGKMFRCPYCGNLYSLEDLEKDNPYKFDDDETDDDETDDDDNPHKCPHCDKEIDDPEQVTMYDYFSDCLDIEYRISGSGEYRSVELCVACGGPNIYVDTGSRTVKLYWWSDRADAPIFGDACEQIDAEFEELYNCTK